ncbi:recombinase family protein [Rathayibacter rathayi]|uniref:recombinase family protein n=1 Tax=Rathayibacter rathayi TaxID=33887 RepID=UPI00215872A6|nr:recombinase family protein [Rathayibacter rathayi]
MPARSARRVGGSEGIVIETLSDLERRGVNIRSLTEPAIDTTTPMGRALFAVVAVFAQLRVDTTRENTMRGLERARSRGRHGDRPSVMTQERTAEALRMRTQGASLARIASVLGVGASSVSRALARFDEDAAAPMGRCATPIVRSGGGADGDGGEGGAVVEFAGR